MVGTILVTGGAGYIGSHTVHQLYQLGWKVFVLDDLSTGFSWALPKEVVFIKGTIQDSALVSELLRSQKIESVIHFAGFIRVEESVYSPFKYYENNVSHAFSFFKTCVQAGVKHFVFSSSAAVYGLLKEVPVNEDASLAPMNPYGRSKAMMEEIIKDYAESLKVEKKLAQDFRYLILRYFNVAGAGLEGGLGQAGSNPTHLIKVACQAACGLREDLPIYGTDYPTPDGTCIRDYIHVDDLALAHIVGMDYLLQGGRSKVLNCGYGHGASVREVLHVIEKISGVKLPLVECPRRLGDSPIIVADISQIQKTLHWKPKKDDLELICKTAYAWELHMQKNKDFYSL